jgi:hypothetical protein
MVSDLTFTGERFLADCSGEIAYSTCMPPGRGLAPKAWLDALPERF